jgi:hypothetical protein
MFGESERAMTTEQKLRWIEVNQPTNTVAINALRKKLGLPLVPEWDWIGKPAKNWVNRGRSSN